MSNSSRNPKNLRELVDKSKMEYEFDEGHIDNTLKNLRNLSQEEKTEIGMLKSRVEEQSRLIMSLKQRADDFIRKNMTLEKLNSELLEQNENHNNEIKQVSAKYKDLLDKFNYLGNNHEQLIVIKDEYKHKNEELVIKNKLLMEKFKHFPNEAEFIEEKNRLKQKIEHLNNNYIDLEYKYLNVSSDNEKKIMRLIEESNYLKLKKQENEELSREIAELNKKNEEYTTRNRELMGLSDHLENEVRSSNEKHLKRIGELTKEKDDLYVLCDTLKKVRKKNFLNLIFNSS